MDRLIAWLNGERGRRSLLATECGITHGAISQWDRVPAERVPAVSRLTGIPPEELRPDIFAPSKEGQAA